MLSVSKLLEGPAKGRSATEAARYRSGLSPVVVWNLTRSCSLACVHCYNSSGARSYPGELTTIEAFNIIDGLSDFKVPAIIFSGGDPLTRPDILGLIRRSREKGIRAVLSTNGVSIDGETAKRIKEAGVSYVGVSIDGGRKINDSLRGMDGAFEKALAAIRHCVNAGLLTGIRFTMSKKNAGELPFMFGLLESEGVQRGYFSHLVYSGRGGPFSGEDLDHAETRVAVDYIFDRASIFIKKGLDKDIVTGGNDADGAYLYLKLREIDPVKAQKVRALLERRGGNSSGVSLANIDNLGEVHPDQFWASRSFGNVKERPFGEIWSDPREPLLKALRNRQGLVKGRCSRCSHFSICAGSYRARAEFATQDPWAEDPACYLTDKEIGI
ncbi:Putative mycofactocin radical SAM maturase MftC [uncultured bacterium]|nr:Putative mycofactocin radical SAM maturase MftC [uncultured bacterium]